MWYTVLLAEDTRDSDSNRKYTSSGALWGGQTRRGVNTQACSTARPQSAVSYMKWPHPEKRVSSVQATD